MIRSGAKPSGRISHPATSCQALPEVSLSTQLLTETLPDELPAHSWSEDEALLRETSETYFETLQLFSVSPWIIYEPTTIDKSEDFDALTRLYRSLIRKISWKSFRGGSIQFTGPQEHGKSAVLKLAHQEISQRSSVVVIDNGKDAMSGYPEGLYGVLVFTLYQIISQKPPLYRSVHNLVSQLIHQHFWTEEVVKTLLSSIFLHSQDVDFVVVVYDFEQWQAEIRAWWLQLRSCFADPSSSTCTFMTSSEEPINGLAPPSLVQHFDLKADYPHQRKSWIGERARYHLDRAYNPSFIQRTLSQELEEEIVSAATKFHGSFAAVSSYLVHLSRSFTLNCPAAIRMNIQASVTSDKDLYQHQISLLESKPPPIRSWAVAILSWVLGAQRPLHVEELAVAAAITFRPISAISDIRDWVSTDMETDLRSHLGGLVELKNLRAHIVSPVARAILVDAEQQQKIGLTAGWELTSTLLGYLKAVFEEGKRDPNIWAKCNSYVSQRHKSEWPRDPALELVDYAARLWPLHFNLKEHQVDSETTALAAQFFNSPHLAKWWFQLYQLSNASLYPLSSQWGTSHQNTVDGIATTETLEDPAAPDTQSKALTPSPAQLAAYAGLKPVVISLLNTTVADRDVQMAVVRRGSTEHGILFMENESILHLDCAIAESDTKTIGRLLDLDAGMVKMRFPVHQASLMGKLEIVQLLHDKLSGPAQVDSDGRTSLHMAAVGGNVEIIGFIVSRQAHSLSSEEIILNKGDTNKKTPLMTAAHMGNAEAAQVLISLGADLLLRDRTGQTALHYAVSNCPQVVRLLVSRDPTAVNIADDAGRTPLHISAARGCGYFGSVAILLDAARKAGILPAAVGAEDKQSWTALHYAAAKGHPEASKLLVDAAKEVDVPLGNLAQPAALAASRGHVETLQVIAGERLDSGHLLAEASRAGQLLMTQYLLTKGLSPDGETLAHRVPLSEAASCGHGSIVHLLLEKGADINMRDSERRTPLHHAAKGGQREVVETLLCYQGGDGGDGANVNAPDDSRMTPLHHAAKGGHVEVVKLILENDRKVNVDALSTSRETPLHLSVKHPDVVSALLGAGADPNSADASHQTPLHMAAENGTLKSFQYLIEYNADPNITNDDGESPMHYAIAHNKVSIVEMLLGICLTAEEDDTSDSTSSKATRAWLKLAIERSALETLGFLLTKWPQAVEWTFTDRNRTLFHMAAEKNSKTDILACLFTAGSEVNHRCTAGRTPLHEAVSASNIEAVRKLLDWNAAVGEADNDGYTPLHLAALYGFDAILDLLLESGSPIDIRSTRGETSLLLAVEANQVDASKKLLQCGASVHLADEGKWTPLHVARDLKIAGLLLKSGADIDCLTSRLVTPLHIAISNRNLEGVKFLLGQGANANLADEEEMTALHYALQQPQEGVGPLIETLLGHHTIQLDKVDKQGVAPVHLAAQYAGVEVLQMLLEKGANFKTHTAAGKSALEIAAAADKGENVNLLLEKGYSVAPGLCWEITDLLVAYWAAVKEGSTGTIEKLVGKEPRLLESRTPEGLNGLELFLRSRLSRGLDINKLNLRSLPELFVTLGLNPFQRLKDDQMSAFELGVISNNELDNGFIRACLKHIPRDPQPPSFGFRELSIAVDIGDLQLWSKLEPALKCVREDSDQDDWNMAQFLHQAKPRVEFNSNITESFTNLEATTKQPTAIILPDIWKDFSAPIGTRFNISSDGLEASFECMYGLLIPDPIIPTLRWC